MNIFFHYNIIYVLSIFAFILQSNFIVMTIQFQESFIDYHHIAGIDLGAFQWVVFSNQGGIGSLQRLTFLLGQQAFSSCLWLFLQVAYRHLH